MSRESVAEDLVGAAHLLDIDYDRSYYGYQNRIEAAIETLEECAESAGEMEEIQTSEVRKIERLKYYVEEHVENEEKNISEIENAVELILNGLAMKIENPEKFDGYNTKGVRYADIVGVRVKSRSI